MKFYLALTLAALTFLPLKSFARLGEDLPALEKRFGEGKKLDEIPDDDKGLWAVFESVMVFEKSGLVITAGMVEGKCEAISYRIASSEGEKKESRSLTYTEVTSLLAKNSEASQFKRQFGNTYNWWLREDGSAFAEVEGLRNSQSSEGATRVVVVSEKLFSTIEAFMEGAIRTEFLQSNPPRDLTDF